MIAKDKNTNKWFVQIQYKDPVTHKLKAKKRRGIATKSEAKKIEVQLMSENSNTSITFHQMSDKYVAHNDSQQVNKNVLKSIYSNHCDPFFETDFNAIGKPELIEWHTSLKNSDLALKTKNRIITSVRSVFKFASDVYDLPNPSSCLKQLKGTSNDDEPMHVWTIEQFNTFIQKIPEGYYRSFFITLFWTGMRRGECLALQCADLTDDGCLDITKSIKHFRNGFTPLKNKGSRRKIKLDATTLEIVKQSIEASGNNGFIFGGDRSLPISNVQRNFVDGIKDSGIPKIRLHDLRHSHATILINNDVNIVAVSKRLGHADVTITLKVYAHLLAKTDNKMMDTISNLRQNHATIMPEQNKTAI